MFRLQSIFISQLRFSYLTAACGFRHHPHSPQRWLSLTVSADLERSRPLWCTPRQGLAAIDYCIHHMFANRIQRRSRRRNSRHRFVYTGLRRPNLGRTVPADTPPSLARIIRFSYSYSSLGRPTLFNLVCGMQVPAPARKSSGNQG